MNTTAPPPDLAADLADFVARTGFDALPASVADALRALTLYNLAMAVLSRSAETVAHPLVAELYPSPAQSTLLATGRRVSAEGAAFANAALMHSRSQDDVHTPSNTHPGATLLPVVLALGEAAGCTGRDLITATALGYEVQARLGRAGCGITTPRGYRASVLYGHFGAAAAAARLLRHSPEQVRRSLHLAAHLAGGVGRPWLEGSDEWPLQIGMAARNGVFAARLGAQPVRTADRTLEGAAGFYAAVAGTAPDMRAVLDGLGRDWTIGEVSLKNYPACAILQRPVRALLDLLRTHGIATTAVREVRATFSPFERRFPGNDHRGPVFTRTSALMSGHYCLALALQRGTVSLDALLEPNDPAVLARLAGIQLDDDPALADQCGRLSVLTDTGQRVQGGWSLDTPTPAVDFAAVSRFVTELMVNEGAGAATAERLIAAVAGLDEAPDLSALVRASVPADATRRECIA